MGSSEAKPQVDPWEPCGPIVDDMKKMYGSDAVKFLRYWHEQFEFPANGSFSESKIEILEEKLNQQKRRTIEKKKIKLEALILLEDMQRVLKMWKAEAERRRRQRERKKKSKYKTYSAATAPLPSGPPCSHCNCTEPTPAPQVQASPTAPANITVVHNSYTYSERSPTLLPPLPAEIYSSRLSTAGEERAAAQALDNGIKERPASLESNIIQINSRLQPVVSHWQSPQTIPSWNTNALPAAPTVQLADNFWTIQDMKDSMKHLPPVTPCGEKFAKELLVFCEVFMPTIPQLKYLVCMHLTLEQYLKIKAKIDDDGRPVNSKWNHKANIAYRAAITDLCNAIREAFPKKVDLFRVHSTYQREGEAPYEFLIRLEAIFDEYSGMSRPDDYPGEMMSGYEGFLAQCFLAGLLPPIRKCVETTCILPNSARLKEVICHASHAYRSQQEATRKEAIQREKELHRAIEVLNWRERGSRGGRNRGRWMLHLWFLRPLDEGLSPKHWLPFTTAWTRHR